MAADRFEALVISKRRLLSLHRGRRTGLQLLLACLLALSAANASAQETSSRQQDPALVPVEKPPKTEVAPSSAFSAAGLASGAGGGLPVVAGSVPGIAKVEARAAEHRRKGATFTGVISQTGTEPSVVF